MQRIAMTPKQLQLQLQLQLKSNSDQQLAHLSFGQKSLVDFSQGLSFVG